MAANKSLPPRRGKVRMGVKERSQSKTTPSLALPREGGGNKWQPISPFPLDGGRLGWG